MKNISYFAMKATSMKATIERSNNAELGELVVEVIQDKFDNAARIDWGKEQNRCKTRSFSTFLGVVTWL